MRIAIATWARFSMFHLARQLHRYDALARIYSTYPRFKLRDEQLPQDKIATCSAIEVFLRSKERFGLRFPRFDPHLEAAKVASFDRYVGRHWVNPDIFIALSGAGAVNGPRAQAEGGRYICARGSPHIQFADDIIGEEHRRHGLPFRPTFAPFIAREVAEYETADLIAVPSTFAARSYAAYGIPKDKLFVNPYGARLSRFHRVADPDPDAFTVLFVGGVSIAKGFTYLLEAFQRLKHPRKQLRVIGDVPPQTKDIVERYSTDGVTFLGIVPNDRLKHEYSRANVLAFPSITDGFGAVMAEALACGCPVIATTNTGAEDFFDDGVEGFIVPIRDSSAIVERLQQLADTPGLAATMGAAGQQRTQGIGGWDSYGDRFIARCRELLGEAV